MKRILLVLAFIAALAGARAHAAICTTLPASPSQTTLYNALNSCGGGNGVQLVAGTTTLTSQINWPCGVSLYGPTPSAYSQTPNQTAKLTGNFGVGNYGPIKTTAGCSAQSTIQYIEWDGQRPGTGQNLNSGSNFACRSQNNNYPQNPDRVCGSGGGNFIYITPGTNHFYVLNDYIHGNNCGYLCGDTHSSLIYMAPAGGQNGCCTYPSGYAVTNDVNVSWNILSALGDCAAAVTYTNNENTEGGGGTCNGTSMQGAFTNLVVSNNRFITGDDELKFYELYTNGGQGSAAGGTAGYCSPCTFNYNHFQQFDRIAEEMQINWGGPSEPTLVYSQYSDWSNHLVPMQQDYDLSMANGCLLGFNTPGEIDCVNRIDYNMSVADTPTQGSGIPGFEYWGGNGSTGNGNFWSGSYNYISFQWDPNGNYTFNNNTVMTTQNNGNAPGWGCALQNGQSNPGHGSTNPAAPYTAPSCNGNYSQTTNGTITSVAPVLQVSGNVVTIRNTNVSTPNGSNPGRDTNTTFWCTTDGTNPVAGGSAVSAGNTAKPYWNGPLNSDATTSQTVGTITASGTIKCLGMWGAPNQPYSYVPPANKGGGYVPSAIVTATTGPAGVATPTFNPAAPTNFQTTLAVTISDSTPNSSVFYTLDGSTPTPSSTHYTGIITLTQTTTLQAIATASGLSNSAVASGQYTFGLPQAVAPTFNPTSESFYPTLAVSIATTSPGATIYYTTNGTTPTTSSAVYTAPISLSNTTQIQAIAAGAGLYTQSAVSSSTYTLSLPAITGCYQGNSGSINQLVTGGTAQMQAFVQYGSPTGIPIPQNGADTNKTSVVAWTSNNTAVLGQNYQGTNGLVVGVAAGTASSQVTVSQNGGPPFTCNEWTFNVSGGTPPTLSGAILSLQGGGTSIPLNGTGQMCANMSYTNPVSTTQVCNSGFDVWGNGPGTSWKSLGTGVITSTNAGVITGQAIGNATIQATIGSFNPTLNISVTVPPPTNQFQLNGPTQFGGKAQLAQ